MPRATKALSPAMREWGARIGVIVEVQRPFDGARGVVASGCQTVARQGRKIHPLSWVDLREGGNFHLGFVGIKHTGNI